jgi:phosphate/sulfate permease
MIKAAAAIYLILAIILSGLSAWRVQRLKRWKAWQIALYFVLSPLLALREAIIILCELFGKHRGDKQ